MSLPANSFSEKPFVIPHLREWQRSTGTLEIAGKARLLVDQINTDALSATADTIQSELRRASGISFPIAMTTEAEPGSIFLTLNTDDEGLGDQGYLLNITDCATVRANTATGVFYGMQTFLQILEQLPDRRSFPQGQARDYPQFRHRAIMLDAGRKYWRMDYLLALMRRMAQLKLNVLHLHFTDWNAFRLQSAQHPGLAAGQAYSKADIAQLQTWADQYHITLVPEIDLPAHATAITHYSPHLAFDCDSMSYARWDGAGLGGWTINYADPKARQWMKELLHEFVPLFGGPYFHIGADEVPDADAPAQCPQLVQYARTQGYAHPGDVLVEWINETNDLVKSLGKRMQIWNWWERSPHSLDPEKDIIVNVWAGAGEPAQLLDAGYQVINSPEDTHYVSPGLDLLPKNEYLYDQWMPNTHPNMLGYKICVWADNVEDQPDEFFEERLCRPRAILAERLWCGAMPSKPYEEFIDLLERTEHAEE